MSKYRLPPSILDRPQEKVPDGQGWTQFGKWFVHPGGDIEAPELGYYIARRWLHAEDWISHIREKNSLFDQDNFIKAFNYSIKHYG